MNTEPDFRRRKCYIHKNKPRIEVLYDLEEGLLLDLYSGINPDNLEEWVIWNARQHIGEAKCKTMPTYGTIAPAMKQEMLLNLITPIVICFSVVTCKPTRLSRPKLVDSCMNYLGLNSLQNIMRENQYVLVLL